MMQNVHVGAVTQVHEQREDANGIVTGAGWVFDCLDHGPISCVIEDSVANLAMFVAGLSTVGAALYGIPFAQAVEKATEAIIAAQVLGTSELLAQTPLTVVRTHGEDDG